MSESQMFCTQCGAALHEANYCPQCGVATRNALATDGVTASNGAVASGGAPTAVLEEMSTVTTGTANPRAVRQNATAPPRYEVPANGTRLVGDHVAPAPTATQDRSTRSRRRRPFVIGIAVGTLVLVAAGALAIILLNSNDPPSYSTNARAAFAPVIQANTQLSATLNAMSATAGARDAAITARSAIGSVDAARQANQALRPGSGDRQLAADLQAALMSERAWLTAVVAVLSRPTSPQLSQLASLRVDAKAKLAAVDAIVPGASASLPDSSKVMLYANARTRAAETKKALGQFNAQVQSFLDQSAPAYAQINQLFGQMRAVAEGGTADMTLAQAEAMLGSVISNRTSLAATARGLPAPTPLSASVRTALIAAYDASLQNDQDISTCLNENNTGTDAIIFRSCLDSTSASAGTATAAKQQFRTLYNQLRQRIGQPPTDQSF
jgi:hypothetical protein